MSSAGVDVIEKMDRQSVANRYLDIDLSGQREWYSKRASKYKSRTQILAILVIAGGILTGLLQVLAAQPWVPLLTAAIGGTVALCEGWQRVARYPEIWLSYRIASEKIKRERRLFTNAAGPYRKLSDADAYLLFVESIELIISEEQQIYWAGGARSGDKAQDEGGVVVSALTSKSASQSI